MVLFTLFFDMVKGDVYNGEEIFAYFVKMAIGSPLFGGCVGMVSVYALSWANKPLNGDDVTVQIAITICCAYMTFFLVESQQAVKEAIEMLSATDRSVISNIMSRQAGRSLLAHQIESVNELVQEGLMSPKDSEAFLELAQKDMDKLEARVQKEFREHVKITQSKRISATMSYKHGDSTTISALQGLRPALASRLTEKLISSDDESEEPEEY